MSNVYEVLPFLPDSALQETAGIHLRYSPSFVDLGRLRRRAQEMLRIGGGPSYIVLLRICQELKASIRGDVQVHADGEGRVRIQARDLEHLYVYKFLLTLPESA